MSRDLPRARVQRLGDLADERRSSLALHGRTLRLLRRYSRRDEGLEETVLRALSSLLRELQASGLFSEDGDPSLPLASRTVPPEGQSTLEQLVPLPVPPASAQSAPSSQSEAHA